MKRSEIETMAERHLKQMILNQITARELYMVGFRAALELVRANNKCASVYENKDYATYIDRLCTLED